MIKADPGFAASYKDADGRTHTENVVAWDDEGHALVLDSKRGKLVPAQSYSNFQGVRHESDAYITAVPGQGWLIEITEQDGKVWTHPVIAFAIDRDGFGTVIAGAGDGTVEVEQALDGEVRKLIPPDGWKDPQSLAE